MPQQLDIQGRTKEEEAIEFLRQHEPSEGYYLGFSGGKDSVVIKELALRSCVKFKSFYASTGIEPPEVVSFIKRFHKDVIFLRPEKSFYNLLQKKSYPTQLARWCCDELKKKPTQKINLNHRILGIRAEESQRRSKRGLKINHYYESKYGKQIHYHPIFYWNEFDVWDFIERHKLEYCKLYDEGFDRGVSCAVCPFFCGKNKTRLNLAMRKWPGIYKAFERSMEKLYEDREWYRHKVKGKAYLFSDFMRNWYDAK